MKVLIGGNGNISKALQSIAKHHKINNLSFEFTTCDLKDGQDYIQYITNYGKNFDVTVNLTDMPTSKAYRACEKIGLDYIDAGVESDDEISVERQFRDMLNFKHPNSKFMFGFGMNPGIIEYIYESGKPSSKHYAIEFETDFAKCEKNIFGTWSVYAYYQEAVEDLPFVISKKGGFKEIEKDTIINIETIDGKLDYKVIPHEEMIYVVENNENCLGGCFLYRAPEGIHKEFINAKNFAEYKNIQVEHNICGFDKVGILYYDVDGKNPYYVFNEADNKKIYKKYGVNGTCWQTAVGVFVALNIVKSLKNGETVTFTDVSKRFKKEIKEIFDDVSFKISKQENFMQRTEFEEKILKRCFV